MHTEHFGDLTVRFSGGNDGHGGGHGPVVVLLHGFGAPGDDLVPLAEVLSAPSNVRYVFPAAPLSLAPLGYGPGRAWWMLDLQALQRRQRGERVDRTDEQPEGLAQARAQLSAALTGLTERLSVTMDRVILGGFSQGSMLACDFALHAAVRPAALILLSSTLIARSAWAPRMEACRGLPILQTHGRQDAILPYDGAERLRDLLLGAGAELTFVPFEGGHELPPQVLDAASRFIATHGRGS
jgi:phospholipase/carboxylesterase